LGDPQYNGATRVSLDPLPRPNFTLHNRVRQVHNSEFLEGYPYKQLMGSALAEWGLLTENEGLRRLREINDH
jgi:hypothetical protein